MKQALGGVHCEVSCEQSGKHAALPGANRRQTCEPALPGHSPPTEPKGRLQARRQNPPLHVPYVPHPLRGAHVMAEQYPDEKFWWYVDTS